MVMVKIREQPSPLSGSSRKLIAYFSLWLCLAAAGCDSPSSRAPGPSANARTEKLKTNLSAEEARALAQPMSSTPGLSVETTAAQNQAIGSETYESQMNPSMGIKTKRLFDTRTESDDERFERLEAAVQALRDDFDKASPSINRLMAIEGEIQTLVDQLQSLVGDNGATAADVPIPPVSAQLLEEEPAGPTTMPPLPPDAQAMQDSQPQAQEPAQQATAVPVPLTPPEQAPPVNQTAAQPPAPVATTAQSGLTMTALRIGDHDRTTRVVFELTGKPEYTASIDPEKILLVSFMGGASQLSDAQLKSKSDLIKSIDVTPQNNGGFIVAMSLAKVSNIVRQGVLPPDAESPNYRVYIDIAR